MESTRETDICVLDMCGRSDEISEPMVDEGWDIEWENEVYGCMIGVVDGRRVGDGGERVVERYDIRKRWEGGGRRMRAGAAYRGSGLGKGRLGVAGCWREAVEGDEYRRRCVLVVVNSEDVGVGSIAHEASHCADLICDMCGVRYGMFELGEAHAYLVGWCAKRIAYAVRRFMSERGGEE